MKTEILQALISMLWEREDFDLLLWAEFSGRNR